MLKIVNKILFTTLITITLFVLSGCNELMEVLNENASPKSAPDALEEYQKGVVTYVVDGDTFDVELENGQTERVRPILVDAPEICHKSSPSDCEVEPYGDEATDFTRELLDGETVYLEQDVSERDRYDRLLAYVYLEDGRMYQELILEEGLAKIAVYEPDTKYQAHLEEFEQTAKDEQINLWSIPGAAGE